MAAGFHCRASASHWGLSASTTGMENITPDAYIHVRITNGISCARPGAAEPHRAMIRAGRGFKRNWGARAGTISSQDVVGYLPRPIDTTNSTIIEKSNC